MALKRREIDRIYTALRPRLNRSVGGGGSSYTPPATIPAHTHGADDINSNATTRVAATNVQDAIEELDAEKLAIDGTMAMTGHLDMGGQDIDQAKDGDFSGDLDVGGDITQDGAVGSAHHSGVRVLSLAGDDDDGEARIENAERIVFNDEPTKSVIEGPSRLDMNTGVEAGVSYTPAEGKVSWDSVEDTLVVYVASGATLVFVAVGWAVKLAVDGTGIPV